MWIGNAHVYSLITYPDAHNHPDVDNLSACGVGTCWQVQASAGRASPTGPCCTGAGRAALINVDGDVVGNGGGITVGQLRDSTCCRWGNPPDQEDSTPCDGVKSSLTG